MRGSGTNKIFPVTSARDRASLIVRISTGADHRRVADSSGHFVRCSASRSRRRQIAALIKGDGTDGAVPILVGNYIALTITARATLFRSLHFLQSLPAFLGEEILLIHQFDPIFLCESLCAYAIEHDMWRLFHDQPCENDRIFDVLHAANCAGLESPAIHYGGIHLVCAGAGEYSAAAGIEVRIVL